MLSEFGLIWLTSLVEKPVTGGQKTYCLGTETWEVLLHTFVFFGGDRGAARSWNVLLRVRSLDAAKEDRFVLGMWQLASLTLTPTLQ